ncbi:glycosyltransferase family 2 protein [Aestuariirhabdus litorea]|uniref:Glycosyltransferase family 2 protein n=1 Tax=Aestuariirhabdus litorea TaxID=2528527 RepID=A0A3P3VPR5_9GAMM|nr:glycosyltransferase family 2 protein [Aestuariirhabdus litorea]RRJ84600.1 glycosyltransferase family 2 protein [Aestuariirhabdus litorea]RWW97826.1 glycosyltransferase [Endozoicomonadaceae bacterium GTF-13]
MSTRITLCFCTYNRAENLPSLVASIREQQCEIPIRILAINNNSRDHTLATLQALQQLPGHPLDFVTEQEQGIVPARNRALEECLNDEFMIFIDDDEIPLPGLIQSAYLALKEGYHVVGGKVLIAFDNKRPAWLSDELLPFLAAIDYGDQDFEIRNDQHPLWTANIAYRMEIFRRYPELRFNKNFNRVGNVVGGGEDGIMFRQFLENESIKLGYIPGMAVDHYVEEWRLRRLYFLNLHHRAGYRRGRFREPMYERRLFGAPKFLYRNLATQTATATLHSLRQFSPAIREWMTVSHTMGMIRGYRDRRHDKEKGQCA